MKRRVLSLLLVALLAAAIGRWTAPGPSEPPPAPAAVATANPGEIAPPPRSKPADITPARPSEPTSPPSFIPPEKPAPGAHGLSFDPTNFLAGLPQQLDQVADRAKGNDAAALGELADWLDYCKMVDMAVFAASATYRIPLQDADSRRDASVAAYFQQLAAICKSWVARHPWLVKENLRIKNAREEYLTRLRAGQVERNDAALEDLPRVLRRRASESGNLLAQARGRKTLPCPTFQPTADAARQQANAREAQACIYRNNTELLARVLSSGDPRLIAAVPQLLTSQNYNWQQGFLSTDHFYSSALWLLTACEFGLDCSGGGPALRNECASRGLCGYGHVRDFVADQQMTPARMRVLHAHIPRLVILIQSGNVEAILGPPPPP